MSFSDTARQLEATDQLLNQAGHLAARGRFAEAEKIYQESLKHIVDLYGPNSLKTCSCLLDLADLYYNQEKFPEVITLLDQVLVTDHTERIFPDEKVLAIKFKFGKALEKNGSIKQASECYSEVLSVANIVCGPTAPFTKTISESLRSLAKRNSSVAQAQHAQQSQTGQTTPAADDMSQFDTFKQKRLKQQATSQKLIPSQSASPKMNKLEVAINQPTMPTVRMRDYDSDLPAAPNFFRKHAGSSITLAAACILCVGLFLSGVLEDKRNAKAAHEKAAGAVATAALTPGALAAYTGIYSSTDGIKQFNVMDSGKGILKLQHNQREVAVTHIGAELYAESEGRRLIFRTSGQSLIDEKGIKLYKNGSIELSTVEAAQKLAGDLNRYYAQYGQYPHSQMEVQSTNIGYTNPITSRLTPPRLMAVSSESAHSSMTLSDYANANWMAANLLSLNGTMGEPGGVETHVFPVNSSGETVIIRGFDRDGRLLPSSPPGHCWATILVSGTIRK